MLHTKGFNVSVANAGRSGDTAAGMLARFDDVIDSSTRVLVLGATGFNDRRFGIGGEDIKASVDAILVKAHAHGLRVVNSGKYLSSLPDEDRFDDKNRHPNVQGHRLIAAELLPEVIAALKK